MFLDANVALYAGGGPHPLKEPCLEILRAATATHGLFTTDAEVLQEVLHVSRRGRRAASGTTVFSGFLRAMGRDVLPIDRADVVLAAEMAERPAERAETRDLIHAAVMARHGIDLLVSADRDFDHRPGVTRLDPARLQEWGDPSWFG